MNDVPQNIPTLHDLIQSLPDADRAKLYQHFQGAAYPDELIYQAWLWANGWIHDPIIQYDKTVNPSTGEFCYLEVLDLDAPSIPLHVLYDFWEMREVEGLLKNL